MREQHSEAYEKARKEYINCLAMSLIGLGVPIYNALKIWKPIMNEELKKEKEATEKKAPPLL